jgi:hypothetical protein
VTLSWAPSTSAGVSGYHVYRAVTSGGPYTKVNSALNVGTSYLDTTVRAGQTYYYVATPYGQQRALSNQAQAVPSPDDALPIEVQSAEGVERQRGECRERPEQAGRRTGPTRHHPLQRMGCYGRAEATVAASAGMSQPGITNACKSGALNDV